MVKKTLSIIASVLVLSGSIFASGFQINEHAARAMAMGGAFTGVANDASAAMFNPAGITQLSGTQISAGVTLIKPYASFRGVAPAVDEYKVHDALFTPINLHITQQINEKLFVSFSLTNPFGLGTTWDDDWVGKYLAVETEVRTFFGGLNLAYKVTDCLSLSAGVNLAYGDVIIRKFSPLPDPLTGDVDLSLEGDATSFGYNVAAFWMAPSKKFSAGVSFRSNSTFEFAGTATTVGPEALGSQLPSGNITATLVTPMNLSVGLGFYPSECLTLSADFQYVGWSSYDKLAVDFENAAYEDLDVVRDYHNTYILRAGAEYLMNKNLALRGGLFYDQNPVKDELVEPSLPDADRVGLNLGIGYNLSENVALDLGYMFIRFAERTIENSEQTYSAGDSPFNGTYNSYAHLFAINFSYKF